MRLRRRLHRRRDRRGDLAAAPQDVADDSTFIPPGRAYSDVAEQATAFGGGRSLRYVIFLIALADNQEMFEADRAWLRNFWAALLPHATGIGSYVNGEAEFAKGQVRDSYGQEKYERLSRIKAKHYSENTFHLNANIPPAANVPRI